jgi:predicted MFS family arabinose efflux permease
MDTPHTSVLLAETAEQSHPVRTALAGLVALAVAMGIGRFAFTPVMPLMLADAGLTLEQAGWLASSNYVGYLVGAVIPVLIRPRPELMVRAGLMSIGITTVAMGLSDALLAWMALRLLAGVSSAWVLIGVSGWCIERLSVYQRPLLTSLVFSGVGIGIATAGLACIGLIRENAGSAAAWIWLGAASLALAALIWPSFSARTRAAPAAVQVDEQRFRWHADPIRLVCCYGIFGFGYIIPATYLPIMTKNALHGSGAFVWSWPMFGIAAAMATLAVAALRRRMSNRSLWAASHWIMASGILLPVLRPNLLTVFAAALLVGSTFMVITLVALQEARPVAGKHATVLIAAMTCAFAVGQIIGPLMIRKGSEGSDDFSTGLILAAVLLVCSTFLLKRSASKP